MKRFAYYIACCSLVALFSCTHDDVDGSLVSAGDGKITIQSTLDDMIITRAADNKPERTITHIDVFAVDKDGAIVYYERDKTGNDSDDDQGKGKLTLGVARQAKKTDGSFYFAQGEEYSFVLVANAVADEKVMKEIESLDELELAVQDDSFKTDFGEAEGSSSVDPSTSRQTLLHLTGTEQGKNEGGHKTPQVFLMDAVATDSQDNTKWVVNSTSDKGNLDLSAEFKRAASKIIVNITQGEDVEFHTKLQEENTQYDFYKLPASTFVLPNQSKLVGVQLINTAPMGPNDETFIWKNTAENKIQVIGYAYSHSWSDVDLTNETSLILNIPMMWNKDNDDKHTKEAAAPRSWYKVPLSQGKKFERNMCYIVNVKINAVGAQSRSTAIKLVDIEYVTRDWVDVPISVGNSEERPKYLILNTDLVEMYNVNFDNTSLSFSSSSAITSVKLKDVYTQNANGTFTVAADSHSAYYINKFGIPTDLSAAVRNTISATPEWDVLNGNISILSPILKTTPEERKLAMAALGEQPKNPTPVAAPSGMPEPTDYLGEDKGYPTYPIENDRPEASQSNYGDIFTVYRYDGTTGKFQKRTDTCARRWWSGSYHYYWNDGTWEDIDAPQAYVDAYNAWVAENAEDILEYQQYLEAKAKYDAYNTAKTAIENSGNAAESHYNTIRYLEFEVTNADGLTATFRVMQYPVVYITNIEGYYSYRSDFFANDGTVVHYQNRKAPYLTQAYWASYTIQRQNGSSWETVSTGYDSVYGDQQNNTRYADGKTLTRTTSDNNYVYYYTYTEDGVSYRKRYSNLNAVFNSDVRVGAAYGENDDDPGRSNLDSYYNINGNNSNWTTKDGKDPGNHRMYHVRITRTSNDYILGRPRLVDENGNITDNAQNGQTSDDADNAKLVSPSFMLASQLGVTSGVRLSLSDGVVVDSQYQRAVEQCKNYVETTYDDTNNNGVWDEGETIHHYDDWRLPTSAEIAIIANLQYGSVAVDEVLAGKYYYCASPTRYASGNPDYNDGDKGFIRCIRDAY